MEILDDNIPSTWQKAGHGWIETIPLSVLKLLLTEDGGLLEQATIRGKVEESLHYLTNQVS